MRVRVLACVFAVTAVMFGAQPGANLRPIIIDTDAGSDDFLAISFLLSHASVRIDGITVANGLAHVDAGQRNLARLVALSGRKNVPVFAGRPTPLKGSAEFPAEWRKTSDDLPGVGLPAGLWAVEKRRAADFLIEYLKDGRHRVRVLALGPLTNLAEALEREPTVAQGIEAIVIMGGAMRVPGNLGDGGVFKTDNKTAEWNLFVDPLAARMIFRSGIPIVLVPLDATNKVPIDAAFLTEFQAKARSPLGRVAGQVLSTDRKDIEGGYFYAWDPLAAVALLDPGVIRTVRMHVDIAQDAPEQGRTVETPGSPNAAVAVNADAAAFKKIFLEAFAK